VSLYLHLNKSSYLRGENIWFQGYAYDRKTNNLNMNTRNVKLGIYDSEGKMIDKKLFLAIDGLFRGQLAIDSTYADGNYYLKAETHYMKNFKEDYAHIQEFEIIGEEQFTSSQKIKSYDLQILAEGGHSVVNCSSHLGFKLINQDGLGIKFKAVLLENGSPIRNFESNGFGHAKVELTPKKGVKYEIRASLPNGKTIKKQINDIKNYGFALNVNNLLPRKTIVQISSHLKKDYDFENTNVLLMVHQEGKHFEVPLYFSEEITTISKILKENQLYYGVNTLTLMVNGKAIAERLIFNYKNSLNKADVFKTNPIKTLSPDSLKLRLSLPKYDKDVKLSISVLPEKTISYMKNQIISSAFLLDPFVNGYIENKPYYFINPNRKVKYDLDLLLLTQGWSKYSWNFIFNNPPKPEFERRKGLTQTFNLEKRIRKNIEELIVFTSKYDKAKAIPIDSIENKTYALENRYPVIGDTLELSYLDDNKNFKKSNVQVRTQNSLKLDKLFTNQLQPPLNSLREIKLEFNNQKLYSNFVDGVQLEEVVVSAKKKEEKRMRNGYIVRSPSDLITVDEQLAATYTFLSDYLVTKGYRVRENPISRDPNKRFEIINMSRISINGSNSPVVFLNGVRLNDLGILSQSRLSDFEEIYVDRSGFGMGVQGAAGVIRLEYRQTPIFTTSTENVEYQNSKYQQHIVKNGFEDAKMFYMPGYANYKSDTFQDVGTIDWFSDVMIPAGKAVDLLIYNTGLDKITLYIEGIAEDGSLINIKKTVEQ